MKSKVKEYIEFAWHRTKCNYCKRDFVLEKYYVDFYAVMKFGVPHICYRIMCKNCHDKITSKRNK